jgi:hypothetical protein
MKDAYLPTLLQMRLLVGFLGERAQLSWWTTAFFGDYSLRSLEFVTPKTSLLAQYHGVLEAARKVHDEHLTVGGYHLFRLPEEVEQDLHAMMQSRVGNELSRQMPRDKDAAMAALQALTEGSSSPTGVGPMAVGRLDQLAAADTLAAISKGYLSQLMLLFTCRANPILGDFIREVYWSRYTGGHTQITNDHARSFVERAIDDGKTLKRWADKTVRNVAGYLTGCCADYGLSPSPPAALACARQSR